MTAGQTLTVTATPSPAADLVINVVPSPASNCSSAATTCVAEADGFGTTTTPEVATYTASAAETVFVIVSRYTVGSAAGTVQFALSP